jgi:hypothetical protein
MNRREALRLLAYTGATVANLGAFGSLFSACARRQYRGSPLIPNRHGVSILIDGLRADLFKEMLDSGALPNIEKHLTSRGTMVEDCVTTFPSATGPAHLPFITGCMPGYNNCPGLRWVDRKHRAIRDYCTLENVLFNSDFPNANHTMYEVLYDTRTVCIFDFVSRGAADVMNVPAKSLWFMLTGDMDIWTKTDGHAADAFQKAYLGGGRTPRYTFVWMPSTDHLAHFHGSKAQVIYDRAADADAHVGRIMQTLQKAGIYDKTIVSLVVDHGLSDTEHHTDVIKVLEGYGLSVMGDLDDNDQFNSLHQNNAARGVSGNSFALLYFAKAEKGRLGMKSYAWDSPTAYEDLRNFPTGKGRVDLLAELPKEQGIHLAIAKEVMNKYRIFSRDGEGKLERDYASFRYTYTGADPLSYAETPEVAPLLDGDFHDKDDWFVAGRKTYFPDALFQISQLFDSERCGDIVVVAERGWDLMDQGHRASHGGLDRAHMTVPCVIAGPTVRQGTIPIARTVDLYPTYLKYLGIPHYDGEVLNVFL